MKRWPTILEEAEEAVRGVHWQQRYSMVSLCRIVLTVIVSSLGVTAQSSSRKWAGASEYNLAAEAFQERDANQQILLLHRWETQYPHSEFERERNVSFALAHRRMGQFNESFARATALLKLDANDTA